MDLGSSDDSLLISDSFIGLPSIRIQSRIYIYKDFHSLCSKIPFIFLVIINLNYISIFFNRPFDRHVFISH